jgi:hypothetical protein
MAPSDWMPWYRSHPRAAILIAAGLFAAVSLVQFLVNGNGEAVDILYSLPVALLAVTFGLTGGLVGAAVGFSCFAAMELTDGVGDIDATGWIARVAGLLLLGVLLGRATDQIAASQQHMVEIQEKRRQVEERARRQAQALEISDSILQHLMVAKWMIEQDKGHEAIDILSSTMESGQRMVAEMLPIQLGAPTPVADNSSGSLGHR